MKKILALLLALVMVFALAACGSGTTTAAPAATEAPAAAEEPAAEEPAAEPVEEVEIIVFAAASMTETLTEIKGMYEAANPGVTITYNFDSSGTL